MKHDAQTLFDSAIRLKHDLNGNPRYYIRASLFIGDDGKMFRPSNAAKYRGKQFQEGWVFTSYNLKRSIEISIGG